jgi:hypothetical protein
MYNKIGYSVNKDLTSSTKTVSIDVSQDTSTALEGFYEAYLKNNPDLF